MSQHKVQSGETLSKIAAKYNVTVAQLVKINGIVEPNFITVGQVLLTKPPAISQQMKQTAQVGEKASNDLMSTEAEPAIAACPMGKSEPDFQNVFADIFAKYISPFGFDSKGITHECSVSDFTAEAELCHQEGEVLFPIPFTELVSNIKIPDVAVAVNNSAVPDKKIKDESQKKKTTWDAATNKQIEKLHPDIRDDVTQFINKVEDELKIQLRVTQGFRSIKEQNDLYAKGRTIAGKKVEGKIVTNAKGGHSNHNYGLAIDIVEIKDKKANWKGDWGSIAKVGKELGFEWGGDWTSFVDKPHFQKVHGKSIKQLRKLHDSMKSGQTFVDLK